MSQDSMPAKIEEGDYVWMVNVPRYKGHGHVIAKVEKEIDSNHLTRAFSLKIIGSSYKTGWSYLVGDHYDRLEDELEFITRNEEQVKVLISILGL